MRSKKIVITGGVLAPAVAVISQLQKKGGWEIYYLGRRTAMEGTTIPSVESRVIPTLRVEFIPISTGRLQRHFTRYTIPSLLRIPLGFFQALWSLLEIKPQLICSFGGYVSVPVVIAGWLLRIPILTHEQTVVFGLASKINAYFAQKVAVSFKESMRHFPKNKVVLTGNPIRKEIFKMENGKWKMENGLPIIYITGGSQGSQTINMAVVEALPKLLEKYLVIHQTGEKNFPQITDYRLQITKEWQDRYFVTPYVDSQDIGWVMNKADLIVSRAGANTVTEIAALGKPALFIPIPWSYQNEQTKNAQMLVKTGIAEILSQTELSGETLLIKISEMMAGLDKYQKNATKAKALIRFDATVRLVEEIERLSSEK